MADTEADPEDAIWVDGRDVIAVPMVCVLALGRLLCDRHAGTIGQRRPGLEPAQLVQVALDRPVGLHDRLEVRLRRLGISTGLVGLAQRHDQ